MLKNYYIVSIFSALVICGCTQQSSAPVDYKGTQTYSRGSQSYNSSRSSSSYNSFNGGTNPAYTAPVPQETVQDAAVGSIGITDLSAPDKNSAPAALSTSPNQDSYNDSQIITERPAAPKPNARGNKPVVKTTVNPWTNKPRSAIEPKTSPKHEVKLAKLKIPQKDTTDFKWPVAGKKIISSFGTKGKGKANDGINIAASEGDPVWAAADGQVVYASNRLKGFGNMVFIKHPGGKTTSYAHLSKTKVALNEKVKRGDIIGYVGKTGNVKNPQLFFSLHKGKEAINPQKYMSSELAGL